MISVSSCAPTTRVKQQSFFYIKWEDFSLLNRGSVNDTATYGNLIYSHMRIFSFFVLAETSGWKKEHEIGEEKNNHCIFWRYFLSHICLISDILFCLIIIV